MEVAFYQSPIGIIKVSANENTIVSIKFEDDTDFFYDPNAPVFLLDALFQFDAFFNKNRKNFDLNINLKGTKFQIDVWSYLQQIPFGETISYHEVAKHFGGKNMTRAIAGAIAKNPLLIVVPCHRVIGSDGTTTGYSGGINRKKWLLDFESKQHTMLFNTLV